MAYIMVDVEADGPIPGDYSMIAFAAVKVEHGLNHTFSATLRPISEQWIPEALLTCGYSREETLQFDEPQTVMTAFRDWLAAIETDRLIFISDNNGFDWQFINWYFHHFLGENPFGHSSQNLGSLYKGLMKDVFVNFKHLRHAPHTHNPMDDVTGNAEALLSMRDHLGLKIKL